MLLAAALGMLTIGSGIGLMTTSAYLISAAALHPSIALLNVAIVGVRFFGIARGFFRYLERYVSHSVTFRLLARLRVWLYQAIEPLAPAIFTSAGRNTTETLGTSGGPGSGDLLSRIVADIETLQDFFVRTLAPPLVAAITGLALWIFFGAFAPSLALAFLGFYLLAGVGLPLLTYTLSRRAGAGIIQARSDLHTRFVDGIQGMTDLVAYNQEQAQLAGIRAVNNRLVGMQGRMAAINGLQNGLGTLFMNLSAWTMLFVAIPLVRSGRLNGLFLAMLVLTALAGFEAVLPLSSALQSLGSSREAARRLFELVDAGVRTQSHTETRTAYTPPPSLRYDLDVQDVTLRYAPGEPAALDHVSFSLPQGRCVAIVGPSGAGKSSIINLLLRFWDYQEGHIYVGRRELREYRSEDLAAMMSVVTQRTHLFNTTIRENLLIARHGASQLELDEALQLAQLYDFVQALPQGYDTLTGEFGMRLSGGERQRLALARAFLRDKPILLLDEPTEHLDALNEQAILSSLRALMRGRTTLLITHRPTNLEIADEILVMRNGRLSRLTTLGKKPAIAV
jgi:ATP-binding cassette subfamily C protein CydC